MGGARHCMTRTGDTDTDSDIDRMIHSDKLILSDTVHQMCAGDRWVEHCITQHGGRGVSVK